jgi:DNA-binding IclR family transcriptional regulator
MLIRWSLILADRLDVTRVARPVLERVAAATGETAILCLYAPGRRQFWAADAAESAHPIRYIWESLRNWGDLHVGSTGKGILAFLPESEREAVLAELPDPIPGLRPLPKSQLRDELAAARERGYVVSHGERFQGAVGVSGPIRDATGRVVGDLVISWPDNRTSPEKEQWLGEAARDAALDVSRGLGWDGGTAREG